MPPFKSKVSIGDKWELNSTFVQQHARLTISELWLKTNWSGGALGLDQATFEIVTPCKKFVQQKAIIEV